METKQQRKYTEQEVVKVYRSAIEQGKRQGIKDLINAITNVASGAVMLKSLIDETNKDEPQPVSNDEPYFYELKFIDDILKDD